MRHYNNSSWGKNIDNNPLISCSNAHMCQCMPTYICMHQYVQMKNVHVNWNVYECSWTMIVNLPNFLFFELL